MEAELIHLRFVVSVMCTGLAELLMNVLDLEIR